MKDPYLYSVKCGDRLTGYIVSAGVLTGVRGRRAVVAGAVLVVGRRPTAHAASDAAHAATTPAAEASLQFVDTLRDAHRMHPVRLVHRRLILLFGDGRRDRHIQGLLRRW